MSNTNAVPSAPSAKAAIRQAQKARRLANEEKEDIEREIRELRKKAAESDLDARTKEAIAKKASQKSDKADEWEVKRALGHLIYGKLLDSGLHIPVSLHPIDLDGGLTAERRALLGVTIERSLAKQKAASALIPGASE